MIIETQLIHVWPNGDWRYDYEATYMFYWKSDDYRLIYVSVDLSDEEIDEMVMNG